MHLARLKGKIRNFFRSRPKVFRSGRKDKQHADYLKVQIERTLLKVTELNERDTAQKAFRVQLIGSLIPLTGMASALAVGCRNTTELDLLEQAGVVAVTGIDLVSVDSRIRVCDMHDISIFGDGVFDFVYCSHALEHARKPPRVLQEFNRLLKSGGYLFCEVPTNYAPVGSDLHNFESAQILVKIIAEQLDPITIVYAENIDKETSNCGTDVARLLIQKG